MRKTLAAAAVVSVLVLIMSSLGLAQDYDALIKEGDQWYAQRGDMAKAKMSAETYRKAIEADPGKPTAYWKLAMANYYIGDNSPEKEKLAIFDEAINAAKKAVELDPNSVPAHYYLGLNYGLYGQAKGIMKSLSLVDPIKEEMAEVIKRDPGFSQGGAYRVLGRMYFKLPGLAGGDNDKSIENLKTALKYGPKSWITHIFLAETYMDEDMYQEAKELLLQAVNGECQPEDGPACARNWKPQAKELLAEVEKELK